MNCEKAKDLLWGYDKQELTAQEAAELEQHLAGCAECRKEAALCKEMQEMLNALPEEELPEGYHAELMQKLEKEAKTAEADKTEWAVISFKERLAEKQQKQKEQKNRKKKQQKKFRQWGMVAAAAVLVAASGNISQMWEQKQQHKQELIYEVTSEETEDMAASEVTDSTAMPLAEETTVEQSRTTEEAGAGNTQMQSVQQPAETEAESEKQKAVPMQEAEESDIAAVPMTVADTQEVPQVAADTQEITQMVADTEQEAAPMMIREMPEEVSQEEVLEIVSLQVADLEEAKVAIQEQIKVLNGQEEASENGIIAVLPLETVTAFYEALDTMGELSWIQTGGTAVPEGAYCKIEIQLLAE